MGYRNRRARDKIGGKRTGRERDRTGSDKKIEKWTGGNRTGGNRTGKDGVELCSKGI